MKIIYCLLVMLCPYVSICQSKNIRALTIGDKVPDISFTKVLNSKALTLKLSQLKGKLIILDFWATWCSNCIKKFDMLDSMQRLYAGKLQVLLVNTASTQDTKEKLLHFFGSHVNAAGRAYAMPTVYGDTLAAGYFPHRFLPHYAWIGADGKCLAITGAEDMTAANIQTVLQGGKAVMGGRYLMEDFDFDVPIFMNGNGGSGAGLLARSTLSRYIPGMAPIAQSRRNAQRLTTQYKLINISLLDMVKAAWGIVERDDRIIFQLPDSIKNCLLPATDSARLANSYAYELLCPPMPYKESLLLIQQDLQRYFGICARKDMLPAAGYQLITDTLLLQHYASKGGKAINRLYEKENRLFENGSLASLATYLNSNLDRYVAYNATVPYNLDLRLPDIAAGDDEALIRALAGMGILLIPATIKTEQFIIYQSPKQ